MPKYLCFHTLANSIRDAARLLGCSNPASKCYNNPSLLFVTGFLGFEWHYVSGKMSLATTNAHDTLLCGLNVRHVLGSVKTNWVAHGQPAKLRQQEATRNRAGAHWF